jgi:hypothetical protein
MMVSSVRLPRPIDWLVAPCFCWRSGTDWATMRWGEEQGALQDAWECAGRP